MRIAAAGQIGSAALTGGAVALWSPAIGLATALLALSALGVTRWIKTRQRLRSALSHRAIMAALSVGNDVAFALFDGGRRPDKRSALIAAQLTPQDLVVPLDGNVAVVLARAGPVDRMLSRLCRCQLAVQQAGARSVSIGALVPAADATASDVLSQASHALLVARSRGAFELECMPRPAKHANVTVTGRPGASGVKDTVQPVICASSGRVAGLCLGFGASQPVAQTLGQITGLAPCRVAEAPPYLPIFMPICAERAMDFGASDAIALALDGAGIAPERLVLCPDAALFAGSAFRDLGVRLATPLLSPGDADRACDGILWLPDAVTRSVSVDPGRYGLLSECLSAAGERDIPVLAPGLSDARDAALLSQLGVTWIGGDALRGFDVADDTVMTPTLSTAAHGLPGTFDPASTRPGARSAASNLPWLPSLRPPRGAGPP